MADDRFGVIDSGKTYDEQSLMNLLGCNITKSENRKRWFKRNFIDKKLRFVPIGNRRLISGHDFHLWVQEQSKTADEWQDDPANESENQDN